MRSSMRLCHSFSIPVVLSIQPDASGVGLGRPLVLAGGHRRHAGMRLLPRVARP